jgi:hypothetical protein
MEFNPTNDTYELTDEESALFGLPEGTSEWPNADASTLLEHVQAFEGRVADMDTTDPMLRNQILNAQVHRAKIVREARWLIANHMQAELSDADLDRLRESESDES